MERKWITNMSTNQNNIGDTPSGLPEQEDQKVTRPENVTEDKTYRFTGNLFTLNVAHLAYLMNMMGVGITSGMYINLPADMKSHFTFIGEEAKDEGKVSES